MMMIPKRDYDLWEDFFKDSFFNNNESKIMRTDILENQNSYDIIIDLPGYEKENIKISVEDGYLSVNASMNTSNEEKEDGKYVKRERYFGECSRSFYIGDEFTPEDIKAEFKNGILNLCIPKKEKTLEKPEKKYISID